MFEKTIEFLKTNSMKRFGFFWRDSYDDAFYVKIEDDADPREAFKVQWEEWVTKLMGYSQNKGKTREFATAEEKLASKFTLREVGDEAIKWNPRPVCCERINKVDRFRDSPPICLQVTRCNDETGDYFSLIDPHWLVRKSGDEVFFCPFCGTKLPEVEKMENPPQPLWGGDDDYCGTCDQRNGECECNPPWTAYRIKT